MNKKLICVAIAIGGLIIVIALGWSLYAHFSNRQPVDVSLQNKADPPLSAQKPVAIVVPTSSTTSTDLEMVEGASDEERMNAHWLSRVNALREQKALEPIVFDARLAHTAKIWADHMGTTGVLSHDRPNGEKVSEWIKAYNLPFMAQGAGNGYRNQFTENIGRAYADASQESLEAGLDQVLTSMVDEGPEGDHYRTIFNPDWNRYGGGFYFEPIAKGRVRVYIVFHYGSFR